MSAMEPLAVATTDELIAVLAPAVRGRLGSGGRIERLERSPYPSATSHAMEEIKLLLGDGRELALLFKNVGPDALLPAARDARPAFLLRPGREIHVYRWLLGGAALGTPLCIASLEEEERGRYWLFLEKVQGIELFQVGDVRVWQEVARWLAMAHQRLAPLAGLSREAAPLLRYTEAFYRVWPRRAREFADAGTRARIETLTERYDRVVEQLLALPTTVIHGEMYPSNVLLAGTRREPRICPVDWEMAAIGPGLMDLAALTSGSWSEDQRHDIAMAYFEASPRDLWAGRGPFLRALDACRLHLAMQWLGWSRTWTPPREHAHDWLGEALRLSKRLRS